MKQVKVLIQFNISEKVYNKDKMQDMLTIVDEMKELKKDFRDQYKEEIESGDITDVIINASIK